MRLHRLRFDQIAKNLSVRVDKPDAAGVDRYVGLEHLDSDCLDIRRWGLPSDVEATKLFFEPGDVIYGRRRAYQRKLGVAAWPGICSAHALVLRAEPDAVHPNFLPFFMQTEQFQRRALAISVGSLSPTINWPALARQEFEIPELPEQDRAVRVLGAAEQRRRAVESVLHACQERKHAALAEQLNGFNGTRPLGDAASWLSGGTPSRKRPDYWDGDIPWLSPKDMKMDAIIMTQESVTDEGAAAGSRMVEPDTVFVVVRGMILAHSFPVARAGRPMAFNQDIKALVAAEGVLPRYLFYWLQQRTRLCLQLVTESSHGTKRLPTDALQAMPMECPREDVQREFVEVAEGHDALARAAEAELLALRDLKHSLLAELIPDAS